VVDESASGWPRHTALLIRAEVASAHLGGDRLELGQDMHMLMYVLRTAASPEALS
jgi:hypothetical protein